MQLPNSYYHTEPVPLFYGSMWVLRKPANLDRVTKKRGEKSFGGRRKTDTDPMFLTAGATVSDQLFQSRLHRMSAARARASRFPWEEKPKRRQGCFTRRI